MSGVFLACCNRSLNEGTAVLPESKRRANSRLVTRHRLSHHDPTLGSRFRLLLISFNRRFMRSGVLARNNYTST